MKVLDFYKVLGIERTASQKEIKDAYYKLARRFHPDLVPSNDVSIKKFNIITQAYKVLVDLDQRLNYKIKLEEYEQSNIFNTKTIIKNNYAKSKIIG